MLGFLTTLIPGGAPRASFPTGGCQALAGSDGNAADIASDAKVMTFQSFMRGNKVESSRDNTAEPVDPPKDVAFPKGESPDDDIDSRPDPAGGEAEVEMASYEPQTFGVDLPLGDIETGEFEYPAETYILYGTTAPPQAGQEAARWFSNRTTLASQRATAAMAAIPNDIQAGELPGQASYASVAPVKTSIAVDLPQNPATNSNILPELARVADTIRGTLGPGVDAPLRIDLPTVSAGVTETHTTARPHGAHMVRHVADQLLEAMVSRGSERSIDVFLNPVELGRVRLTLMHTEGGMIVKVTAERAETLDLMSRHSDTLGQEFQDLGYGGTDFTFAREGQVGGWDESQSDAPLSMTPEPEFQPAGAISLRVGLTDRLDIRL